MQFRGHAACSLTECRSVNAECQGAGTARPPALLQAHNMGMSRPRPGPSKTEASLADICTRDSQSKMCDGACTKEALQS
jgi:hypothetical protein